MSDKKQFPYLFSPTPLLLEPNAISTVPIAKEKLEEIYAEDTYETDSDLLSHSDMSWGSLEDRYVPFEILCDETTDSTISSVSSMSNFLSSTVLDQMPVPTNEEAIQCAHESSWGSHALDINSWDDYKAPVVKLRQLEDVLFDDFEFCGIFTDKLIGIGSSFLAKSPENGLYVLNKCVMRNMLHDISSFWSIVHLDLSHNAIEAIDGLENLKYLKHLNLSYNLIERIEKLDRLNIQELNLEGNCITAFESAIPRYGINTLPHLRKINLGYNKLSSLQFFKDGYSLRVIDLKFNRINDLLELSNFKGLIQEIDLRGNGCTKWPNYKGVLLFSIPSIQLIDGKPVSTSEKVGAATLFASPVNLRAARTVTKLTLLEQLSTPKIDLYITPYDEPSPPLIILTGPSAVKKISLALNIARVLSKKVMYCQWHTTKEPEHDQVEQPYNFVNREEFNDISRCGDFLAIEELLGNSYGFHHNQIASLILEKKIGITQMHLHATMQMSKRYPNIKPVLVLTESESVHHSWIQEKFDVYTCIRDSKENFVRDSKVTVESTLESTNTTLNFMEHIVNDIINSCQLHSNNTDVKPEELSMATNKIETKTVWAKEVVAKNNIEMEEKRYIKFQDGEGEEKGNETDHRHSEHYDILLGHKFDNQNELRVILDEYSNVIIEDEHTKRERHQAKLLYRRNTLLEAAGRSITGELSESMSSEETLTDPPPLETKKAELLKDIYTDLVIKTRKMYLDHHINQPGFFSLVLLTDDYVKSFNSLVSFIYEMYINHSTAKPKYFTELEHFTQVAVPAMNASVVDEIQQSLSISRSQRETLLRIYGITSWKDLMPSQRIKNVIKSTDLATTT
ncbi:uncharacterized protein LOC143374165 [Andrena cerasifolii]|uniref:uncharacterized protein LOC143374165 n=1 Tax=Andrena cerasifolii TaxID=2819439 RepID=UPI004037DE98